MTVGDGILWSTVVVVLFVAAYQVSVRGLWKGARRVFGVVALAFVVTAFGYWAWKRHQEHPHAIEDLLGVKLGMRAVEVRLLLGAPSAESPEPIRGVGQPAHVRWRFIPGSEGNAGVQFRLHRYIDVLLVGDDEADLRVDVICSDDFDKPWVSEEEYSIEQTLGPPTTVSIAADLSSKYVSFKHLKLAYKVSRGKVVSHCVTNSGAIRFLSEYQ